MTPLLKGGVALLTVGTVSTAGYFGGTYLFGGTPIKDLISEEFEYILLSTEGTNDSDAWETNWKSYTTANKDSDDNKDTLQLKGWKKGGEPKLVDELKKKCKELSETKVSNNKDTKYSNVTSYCARRVTIKDQLSKDKLEAIDTSGAGNTPWEEISKKTQELGSHFANLEIKATPSSAAITADNVKNGCKEALAKDKSKTNFSTIYASFKAVCVNKS